MSPPPASWIRKIDITANLEGVEQIPLGHGVLTLSDYGCAMYGVLVLNGLSCGRVWMISGDAAYDGPFGGCEPLHAEGAGDWEGSTTRNGESGMRDGQVGVQDGF